LEESFALSCRYTAAWGNLSRFPAPCTSVWLAFFQQNMPRFQSLTNIGGFCFISSALRPVLRLIVTRMKIIDQKVVILTQNIRAKRKKICIFAHDLIQIHEFYIT